MESFNLNAVKEEGTEPAVFDGLVYKVVLVVQVSFEFDLNFLFSL